MLDCVTSPFPVYYCNGDVHYPANPASLFYCCDSLSEYFERWLDGADYQFYLCAT
jgi:hypothetical protein